jgi:predicted ATPase
MLKSLTFIKDWRCFKTGDDFEFRPGVNLVVGDQGCGKSSLLETIKDAGTKNKGKRALVITDKECTSLYFDFEKGNPRTLSYFGDDIMGQMAMMFSSHGESVKAILKGLDNASDGVMAMLDEPDSALSIRSCMKLVARFKNLEQRGVQVIAAVHNPVVIQAFEQVYSLEHRLWMTGSEFMGIHLEG